MKVLVTGGAGYIGSHTAHLLAMKGYDLMVLDNLDTGHSWAVPPGIELIRADVRDSKTVFDILRRHEITDVIHFAAHIEVEESVRAPLKYYNNNSIGTISLIQACLDAGVKRFVFSSTSAVYGEPNRIPVTESDPKHPINPYGASKLFGERILTDVSASMSPSLRPKDRFRFVILRYFNVAGAQIDHATGSTSLKIGEATANATHLIKLAAQAACGIRKSLSIFGTDYRTADGTCVRDYIHVDDLADAHLGAMAYLKSGGESDVFNCGYGHGYSVHEVIDSMKRVSGIDFPTEAAPRRAGDPSVLIADARKIKEILNWEPRYNDLDLICRSAYLWEKYYRDNPR